MASKKLPAALATGDLGIGTHHGSGSVLSRKTGDLETPVNSPTPNSPLPWDQDPESGIGFSDGLERPCQEDHRMLN